MESSVPGIRVELKENTTRGDMNTAASLPSIGGKGLFTAELEAEILEGTIDFAVHSLKDLPTEMDPSFSLGAISERRWGADVLVSRTGLSFRDLPKGAVIGTSSPRRESQLKRIRPDLHYKDIRGNVDTRIKKVKAGDFDATVLAEAGLRRLGLESEIVEIFTLEDLLPAPGQGALAVQCRADTSDDTLQKLLRSVESRTTRIETAAERAFLHALSAGCSTPVGARSFVQHDRLRLVVACLSHSGEEIIRLEGEDSATVEGAKKLGEDMASKAIQKGFRRLV